jgi:cardiolipin synthase
MHLSTSSFLGRKTSQKRLRLGLAVVPWLLSLWLAGCASVPNINATVDAPGARPHFAGARGPLTSKQSKAILAKLKKEGGDTDVMQRHMALEGAVDDTPISVGNKVTVLPSGDAAFAAIFKSMEGAKESINLEYYTFENVEHDGRKAGDVLLEKVRSGVQVNVIYDSIGSSGTPEQYINDLRTAGVNVVDFNPANPLEAHGAYAPNNRDHRKIMVVDGNVAVIGGINLSQVYSSIPFHSRKHSEAVEWKDTDVKIEGPAVAQLQHLFLETWKAQGGPTLDESKFFPQPETKGSEIVHVLGSSPTQPVPNYYASVLSAIRNSENSIWISAAYFVPTKQEMHDLVDAAGRGVDVKLLLPGMTDSDFALHAGHSRYHKLLKSGVEIYEAQDAILHSKTGVIDGVWSVIGSSNFDHRSVIYNAEVDVVVLGKETAGEMEKIFREDIAQARKIDLATWSQRPFTQRFKEFFARIWQNLL